MGSLLRKDLYVIDKQMRLMLVLAVVFVLIPPTNVIGNTYAMLLPLMMPMTLIAYDEKSRWDRYAAVLPYTPGRIVGSKYVLCGAMMVVAVGIVALGQLCQGLYGEGADWDEAFVWMGSQAALTLFINLIALPCLYRFGAEKGRYVMMGLFLAAFLGFVPLAIRGIDKMDVIRLPARPLTVVLLLAAAALLAAGSFWISVRCYRRRNGG